MKPIKPAPLFYFSHSLNPDPSSICKKGNNHPMGLTCVSRKSQILNTGSQSPIYNQLIKNTT
jgi:hypothetical protein